MIAAFVVSVTILLTVTLHSFGNLKPSTGLAFGTRVLLVAIGMICSVLALKRYPDMPGYAVSLRLGAVIFGAVAALLLMQQHRETIVFLWLETVRIDLAGVAFIAMLLGIIVVYPCNWLFPCRVAIHRLFTGRTLDGMESLFYYAGTSFQQIMVTLRDGKVYIGYVDGEIPISGRSDEYVTIVPTASGHREPDSRRLKLTTFYAEALERVAKDGDLPVEPADLGKVIPFSDIASAGVFIPDFFKQFDAKVDVSGGQPAGNPA